MVNEERAALVKSLQKHQKDCGYISESVQKELAEEFRLTQADVKGVISFYAFLSEEPGGKNIIRTCGTICCTMAGGEDLYSFLKKRLKIREDGISECRKFTLEKANCMGLCDQAPAMIINDQPVGHLTEDLLEKMIRKLEEENHND